LPCGERTVEMVERGLKRMGDMGIDIVVLAPEDLLVEADARSPVDGRVGRADDLIERPRHLAPFGFRGAVVAAACVRRVRTGGAERAREARSAAAALADSSRRCR